LIWGGFKTFCYDLDWTKHGKISVTALVSSRMVPMSDSKKYPDISDLIARKAMGRIEIKQLTFGQKIELMEALRERLAPFKALREARRRQARHAS